MTQRVTQWILEILTDLKILKDSLGIQQTELKETLSAYKTTLENITKTITDRQERTEQAVESLQTQFNAHKTLLDSINSNTQTHFAN